MLSFIDHTRERLSDHSGRQDRGSSDTRADQRSHHGVWDLFGEYAGEYAADGEIRKRQYHSENRFDIAFFLI